MSQRSEAELLKLTRLAQSGNREALADLLRLLQDTLWRFCLSQLGQRIDAEEATQEAATRIVAHVDRFAEQSTVTTWALGIALNVCRELRRNRKRLAEELAMEPVGHDPSPNELLALTEQASAMHAALNQLPERQREVVVLRYLEQLSVEQTAVAMACETGTVKATLWQALRKLRQALVSQGNDA